MCNNGSGLVHLSPHMGQRETTVYLSAHTSISFLQGAYLFIHLSKIFWEQRSETGLPVTSITYFCSVYSCALFCVFLQCVQFGRAADAIMSLHVAIELSIHIKTCRSLAQNDLVIMLTLQPDTL